MTSQTSLLPEPITSFQGEYRWLSNFWPARVVIDGITYATTEHAYQAQKAGNLRQRVYVVEAATAGEAKKRGKTVELRSDWDKVKVEIMYKANMAKYLNHLDLQEKLLATGTRDIIEGNTWGDTFWGAVDGKGQNHLGRIIMQVRFFLRNGDIHAPPDPGPLT